MNILKMFLDRHLPTTFLLLGIFTSFTVLAEDDLWDDDWGDESGNTETSQTTALPFNGFIESTSSYRTRSNPAIANNPDIEEEWVAQEIRARLEYEQRFQSFNISLKGDLFYDDVLEEWETENRETLISFTPHSAVDVSAGRQVLTWGTGDLLFLNDFFPKNWVAFFSGYDMQYLKAPSDALKVSTYTERVNLDLVWSPEFDADRYITGTKLSFYSPFADDIVAAPPAFYGKSPEDGEVALRLYKTVDGVEYAGYAYNGFYKTPQGFDSKTGTNFFPELSSIGASVRSTAWGGIANAEFSYWHSRESDSGKNPFVPHSQTRLLVAYERELISSLTTSVQYYLERLHDYELLTNPQVDEYRQMLTTRWTYLALQNRLQYSAFIFYSPSDKDYDLIANLLYRYNDQWQFNVGANVMDGEENYTQFGQMKENSNLYARAKFNY